MQRAETRPGSAVTRPCSHVGGVSVELSARRAADEVVGLAMLAMEKVIRTPKTGVRAGGGARAGTT
jgi:hypothetical protein